jgi:hypothetical protein
LENRTENLTNRTEFLIKTKNFKIDLRKNEDPTIDPCSVIPPLTGYGWKPTPCHHGKNLHQWTTTNTVVCLHLFVCVRSLLVLLRYHNEIFFTQASGGMQQQGRLPNSLLCINREAGRV